MKKDNHYFAWGLTAVAVVCTVLLFYDVVFRTSIVLEYMGKLLSVLAPVLYGCAIAYLLSPVVNWFERAIFRHGGRRAPVKWVRAASLALTWVVVAALLYGLLSILVPELYKSVMLLVGNAQNYYNTVYNWVMHLMESNPEIAAKATELINEYYTDALTWLNNNLMPQLQNAVQAFTGGLLGVLAFLKNLLLGVIVSIYLMGSKEGFAAASCKLCYTLLPEGWAAEEENGQTFAENDLGEAQPLTVLFQVEQCVDELSVSRCMREQRVLVDMRAVPELYLQIAALSMGIPQIVGSRTQFVKQGRNGIILQDMGKLPAALRFYLDNLVNWNDAKVCSYVLRKRYTTDVLMEKWREVIKAIG